MSEDETQLASAIYWLLQESPVSQVAKVGILESLKVYNVMIPVMSTCNARDVKLPACFFDATHAGG